MSCSIGKTAPPVLEPIMVREPERRRRKPRSTFSFVGWPQWPDNEDYSFEFMRVLATATEGASTVSDPTLAKEFAFDWLRRKPG